MHAPGPNVGLGEAPFACACCGGTEHMRPYSPWHNRPICKPCFIVWYDWGLTVPAEIGAKSLELKAAGKFPWARGEAQLGLAF